MLRRCIFLLWAMTCCAQAFAHVHNDYHNESHDNIATNDTIAKMSVVQALREDLPAINVTIGLQGSSLAGPAFYWADGSGVSPVQALLEGQFKSLRQRQVVFFAKKHWYVLKVFNPTSQPVTISLATGLPSTPFLRAYWVEENLETIFSLSAKQRFDERPVHYPLLFIPLEIPPATQKVLLLEHRSMANYPLSLRLLDDDNLQSKMSSFTLARGFVFGALFIFFVLFFAQCLASPSRALAFYCCYIGCLILLVGHIFGYNFAYLWPDHGIFNQRFMPFITGITYGFYFLFSASLFNLKALNLRLYRLMITLAVIAFILAIVNVFVEAFWLLAAAALVGLPVPVFIALWAKKQRLTSANLFFAGTVLHSTLSYLLALECLGLHLGYSYYLFSFLSAGQIVDLALFSTALLRQASELRKTLKEQLKQRLSDAQALAQAERAKAEVLIEQQHNALDLACATHDLNQPLAAIRFALALVDGGKNTPAKNHIVNTLNYTQELLQSMTNSGKVGYEQSWQKIYTHALFASLEARHASAFKDKPLMLRFKSTIQHFDAMPVIVQRILDNLLVNAGRYTSSGGVLLSVRRSEGGVLLQVWDTGIGMSPEKIEQFKQPFSQANTLAEQGFGLGLFIVKSLAEQAGYLLTIRSRIGCGSCVSLWVAQPSGVPRPK